MYSDGYSRNKDFIVKNLLQFRGKIHYYVSNLSSNLVIEN